MKKLLLLSLILVFSVSTMSLAAVSKKKTTVKTTTKTTTTTTTKVQSAPAYVPVAKAPKSMFTISPKLGLVSGITSTFGLGVEGAMQIMPSVDGMAELMYVPGNGYSVIMLGGNGVYRFAPVENLPVNFYAGGGLIYAMVNWGSFAATTGNVSGFGFQGFGGIDYPIPGAGTVFGQLKYAVITVSTPSQTIGGITFGGASYNAGGFGLEGGYRIVI